MRLVAGLLLAAIALVAMVGSAGVDGVTPLPVARFAGLPSAIAVAPEGGVFVALRGGEVRLVPAGGGTSSLVLREQVATEDHRGLLGLALHGDYPATPVLFASFTCAADCGAVTGQMVVYRYGIAAGVAQSRELVFASGIVATGVDGARLNLGGALAFGPDGALYLTVGDHCDPSNDACERAPDPPASDCGPATAATCNEAPQDIADVRGKVLRLDPAGSPVCMAGEVCGSAAAGNPFDGPGASLVQRMVFAYGLRNSYGLAFHLASTAAQPILFATDNGSTRHDEIDRIRPGGNYGWPFKEGNETLPGNRPPPLDIADPLTQLDSAGLTALAFPGGSPLFGAEDLLTCQFVPAVLYRYRVTVAPDTAVLEAAHPEAGCAVAVGSGAGAVYWTGVQDLFQAGTSVWLPALLRASRQGDW